LLEIERYPSFLSPSALLMAETSPNKFYINRLSALNIEKEPQTLAAAIGSAFDYYIKEKIITDKLQHKILILSELKKSIEVKEANNIGKEIFNKYLENVPFDINEYQDVEICKHIGLNLMEFFNIKSIVPIYMKIDAIKNNKIHDWKVSGWTSIMGTSPKPGYYCIWDNGRPKSCHENYYENIELQEIDVNWATQLCTYGWYLGLMGKKFLVTIDLLCFNNRNELRVAKYQAWITPEFQKSVATRYALLWQSILTEKFLDRIVSHNDINLVFIASQNETWWS